MKALNGNLFLILSDITIGISDKDFLLNKQTGTTSK